MRHRLFDEPFAEGAGVGEVEGKPRIAVGAFRRLVKEVHVVARIVGELVGVARIERFRCAENSFKRLRV